jgi:hypothetical protein
VLFFVVDKFNILLSETVNLELNNGTESCY